MSTLSGIAAKGEKGKPRFRSLDINNLYSPSRGESLEPNQHKNTASRRHGGMQSLGKVPSARRPANLPSLKSEYSGNDPAISLVPSGGTGWGSKPGETGPPPTATQAPTTSTSTPPIVTPTTSPPATVAASVSTPAFTAPTTSTSVASTTIPSQSHGDKSWSSITSSSSENTPMFLAHQSPYFQQQFPSLSGDGNLSGPNKIDPAHLPGPSLRPQNEGNWIQGGGRPQGQMGAGVGNQQGTVPVQGPLSLPHLPQGLDVGSNLGPSGVGGGPAGPMPSTQHFRLMPPFMLKHNMAAGGFPPNYQHGPLRPRFSFSDSRFMPPNRGPPNVEQDDVSSRPIIKEEDLKVMDEIGRDTGWAGHDEIDYNQTLSFSDEEGVQDEEFKGKPGRQFLQNKEKREAEHKPVEMEACSMDNEKLNQESLMESVISTHNEMRDSQLAWQLNTSRPSDVRQGVLPPMVNFPPAQVRVPGHQGARQGEDDEVLQERRRIHTEELAIAVERAKQRKEEEEKRYEETRQAAARKLQILEEKMKLSKNGLDKEESNVSPPHNVQHGCNVLNPEREKDQSRKNSEEREDKSPKENVDNFRNTQTDNRGQNRDRENVGQHSFARQQFLPPRLQRQAAENRPAPYYRQGSGSSPQPPSSGNPQYDVRWQVNPSGPHFGGSVAVSKNYRGYKDSQMSECEKEDNTRELESGFESRDKERNVNCIDSDSSSKGKEIENDRFQEEKGNDNNSKLSIQEDAFIERCSRESVQDNKLETEMPDSRGSRDDRLIEESNAHETMSSWADFTYNVEYNEDKGRKDESDTRRDMHTMQSTYQRHIPGPITKEKLEASELKCESTRSLNLVPLTRSEPKTEVKKSENKWDVGNNSGDAWQQVPAPSAHQPVSIETEPQDDTTSQPLPDATQDNRNECQQDLEDSKKSVSKPLHIERDHLETSGNYKSDVYRGGRGGQRGVRHDSQRSKPWPNSYYRGASSMWQRDRGPMPPNRRSNLGRDWGHHDPESEASDEVSASTESGKEDRRHDQDRKQFSRSPKRGVRKSDKEVKDSRKESDKNNYSMGNENRRYDKKLMYENNQMGAGFEPSGVPSRRGRGAFRSKGSSTSLGRGMVDGYGPPTSKKPFSESMTSSGSQEDKKTDGSQNKEDGANDMSHDEKMKLNQQQLSAGIIANTSRHGNVKSQSQSIPPRLQRKDSERKLRDRRPRDSMKSGSGSGGEVEDEDYESTSEQEDKSYGEEKQTEHSRKPYNHGMSTRGNHRRSQQSSSRNYGRDKNNGSSYDKDHHLRRSGHQPMVNGSTRNQGGKDQMTTEQSLGEKKQSRPDYKEKRNNLDRIDLSNTASVVVVDDQPEVTVEEDQRVFATDNNGFQEVRSKKNVKEANRQQKEEPQRWSKERPKPNKPPSSQSPGPPGSSALSSGKVLCDRTRSDKLAPRFMKLKQQNRQEKITQQQQTHDVGELNKINQSNLPGFPSKDMTNPAPPPQVNAWAKPITAALHSSSGLIESCNIEVADHMHSTTSSQRSSPNEDKAVGKQPVEKAMLDGSSPPVQTIIFENTNYKAAPADVAMKSKYSNQVNKNQRPDKCRDKNIEEDNIAVGFKSPGPDIQMQDTKAESIQMPISYVKNEDSADMKLDFRFDSELSQLTDDKSSKSITSIQMTRSIQMATQSSAADLQFKLASVKKVWENPPTVLEHGGEEANNVAATSSFTPTFGNSVEDPGNYGKPNDPSVGEDGSTPEGVYNSSQQLQNNSAAYNGSSVQNMIKPDPSSNVCKVKPLPQSGMHPHAGPLSPPVGPFTSSLAQPNQHINYQPPPGQYGGIPAIPSPPTMYTQSHEHLYQAIQINNSQMLNRQATSQFSQFTPYISQGLGQTSGFSQQNMYLAQTAPPPPTGAAAPAHPDMFQTQISQFRIQPPAYGANQQMNTNPSTMLISSTSMKPPPQPIGAIGSKAASYQPPSQPPSQLLIYSDPQIMNQNYIQNSQMVQRPPNSVVSAMPPSSASYYSASTGGNATAYFQPGNSNMHHLPPFSTQTPAATPAGMGSFGSMAQQYRSTAPSYLKSAADHQDALSVFSSPATQSNSPKCRSNGSSGKQSTVNCTSQQQPSPTQSYKFTTYQQNIPTSAQLMIQQQQQRGNVNVRRYPTPIQRPVTFQPIGRHRLQTRFKLPPPSTTTASLTATTAAHYYVTQNNSPKLVNTNLENKDELVANDCEMSSPAASTTDIATDNSTNID